MKLTILVFLLLGIGCSDSKSSTNGLAASEDPEVQVPEPVMVVLGTVQDAGSPHIGCKKSCCESLFSAPDPTRKVVSLGIIDAQYNKTYLLEATPDISEQLEVLKETANSLHDFPDGIFLTHAHIGHYTGLMYLGKEAANTDSVAVYVMPLMKNFLENNGPWDQLVANRNISIKEMAAEAAVKLTPNITLIPFRVPHRDEYSETVGYKIIGPNKTVLFIPDIDKWEKWKTSVITAVSTSDFAFIDASFYDASEINNRDISEIPHPFVVESMKLFEGLTEDEKSKINFIHFNHTNPLLDPKSIASEQVQKNGFQIARFKQLIIL